MQTEGYENFEKIKKFREDGTEYWSARDLSIVLQYKKWKNFEKVINKAKLSCENTGVVANDDFASVGKIVKAGATHKKVFDYELSRYACYLIAQNGDPRKKVIALAQAYFAIQTRKQEISEKEYSELTELDNKNEYSNLVNVEEIYNDIRDKIINARSKMLKHIDTTMTEVYWYVGKITYELSEKSTKSIYGKKIVEELSLKLTNEFGNGFSPVSIRRMRRFYEIYPIWSTVSTELSWAHFQELIRIDRKEEREFYESESIKSNWGCRELRRQINTKLYDRYLISPNKGEIIENSKKGLIESQPEELLKTPYIFEFAGLKENRTYLETDLERALITHLTEFLLELGRGFSFVANQQRIKIGSEYYYPDLIFYNRLAKCFVIIDLKIGKLTHQDIGQMQMYVNYYKTTQMIKGENEPIGILLCADKDDAVVEMTLGENVKNVYASKYLTYLPSKEELINIIKDEKELFELSKETETTKRVNM